MVSVGIPNLFTSSLNCGLVESTCSTSRLFLATDFGEKSKAPSARKRKAAFLSVFFSSLYLSAFSCESIHTRSGSTKSSKARTISFTCSGDKSSVSAGNCGCSSLNNSYCLAAQPSKLSGTTSTAMSFADIPLYLRLYSFVLPCCVCFALPSICPNRCEALLIALITAGLSKGEPSCTMPSPSPSIALGSKDCTTAPSCAFVFICVDTTDTALTNCSCSARISDLFSMSDMFYPFWHD